MGTYKIRKIDIPAAGRNIDYKYKNSSSISSSVADGGSSVSLPSWLQFVEYDDVAGSIRFKKHLLSEGEVSAWQTGEFSNNVFDNLPKASKTSHGIVRVGNGISVSADGIISLDSTAVTPQTLSISNNILSILNGNSVDLSTLQPDLTGYYDKGETDTLLGGKAALNHNHTFASLVNKPTTVSGYGITDGVTTTDLSTGLNTKANTSHTHGISNIDGLSSALAGKAPSSHTHAIGDVTNLTTTLAGKAASSHTHSIANVSGLQTELNNKLNNSLFDSLFELKTDGSGIQYIQAKHSFVSVGEISAYAVDSVTVPSVFDSLPIASTTSTGIVRVGYGINVDTAGLISLDGDSLTPQVLQLTGNILTLSGNGGSADLSLLTPNLSAYATQTWVTNTAVAYNAARLGGVVASSFLRSDVSDFKKDAIQFYKSSTSAYTSMEGRDDGVTSLLHKWRNKSTGGYEPYKEAWYDGVAYKYLGADTSGFFFDSNTRVNGDLTNNGIKVALQNVSILAGNGLSGGGAISASRTLTLGTPSTISATSTNSVIATSHSHVLDLSSATANNSNKLGNVLAADYVQKTRSISAGNGLIGGGDLSSNKTITLGLPSTITNYTSNSVSSETHNHAIDLRNLNLNYPLLDINGLAVTYTSETQNPTGTWAYSINAHNNTNSTGRRGFTLSVPHNSDALYFRGVGTVAGATLASNYFGNWLRVYSDNYHPSADNSDKFGGLTTSSFLRSDVDDFKKGNIRFYSGTNTSAFSNIDARADGTTVLLHKYRSADGTNTFYKEAWYDGTAYSNIGLNSAGFFMEDNLDVSGNGKFENSVGLVHIGATSWRSTTRATIKIETKGNDAAELDLVHNDAGNAYGWVISARNSASSRSLGLFSRVNSTYAEKFNFSTDGNFSASGNIVAGTSSALVASQTAGNNANTGLSLYSNAAGASSYGIQFMQTTTAGYGTHGAVSGDWAMYFNMNNFTSRGWVFRAKDGGNAASISTQGNFTTNGNVQVGSTSSTNRTVTVLAGDGYAAGFEAYGNAQGTGYLYVGQSATYGGGIEYNGDNNPTTTGAGADYVALYRRSVGVDYWTARNYFNNNDWEFRGNLTALGEVSAYSSSDSRLKFNIRPIQNALTIIDKINPVTFQWNDKAIELNGNKTKDATNYGVIAQELELILPDLVHTTNGFKSVDYIQLTGLMLKAIKELGQQNRELKQEINELKLR